MITYLKEQNLTPKASIFLPVFCKFALLNTTSIGMDVFSPRPSEPKKSKHMIMRRSLFILFFPILCLSIYAQNKPANEAGTLTAYYATTSFDRFKKGDLVCDSNDPINRIVDLDTAMYKYEGDDTGVYYSSNYLKSDISKVVYTMSQLPVDMIGDKAMFKSEDGYMAKIFKSDNNGHKYYVWNDDFDPVYSKEETKRHDNCYVLSKEFYAEWLEGVGCFEAHLEVKDGNIELYRQNPYYDGNSNGCRYRPGLIGIIEETWWNKEGWEGRKYGDDGKLLVDQYEVGGVPGSCSIAYLADKDALYIDGTLYYRVASPPPSRDANYLYEVADEPPSFPGGKNALVSFLGKSIHYPSEAQENNIQGRVVVSFVVETDGSISNVAVVKSVDPALDKEAVRVIKHMPKWIPGKDQGEIVRVKYTLPVTFKIN